MDKETHRRELIEDLGIHFENEYSLAPLSARIFASLVMTEEDGLTFDDCLTRRGASKSSISTSLNLLLQMGFIKYFTKSKDRKRYYTLAEKDSFMVKKLTRALKQLENEEKIMAKVTAYNEKFNPEKFKSTQKMKNIYLTCLKENKDIFQKTIDQLNALKE
ncbi:GbsR/MarR family transcriptional regulator [Maribacter polysaccharolyticus]|uniref:GbsR/MarR family transcriptional regulator n=1 Tax=Maribacter polysaccharolyticus TaxID=3020831 RepID=UPI00237F91CA|nr:transcriptional regulator [Maribacter polysaccharolyticus]MDE3743172.1 transcriptional regulator [Maribacter polysaccharolyticus]